MLNAVFGRRPPDWKPLPEYKLASLERKYVPARSPALYIEESLDRGTQWVVFEPNDEPLWAQIRFNVAFIHDLFSKGAFQEATPFVWSASESKNPSQRKRKNLLSKFLGGFEKCSKQA